MRSPVTQSNPNFSRKTKFRKFLAKILNLRKFAETKKLSGKKRVHAAISIQISYAESFKTTRDLIQRLLLSEIQI